MVVLFLIEQCIDCMIAINNHENHFQQICIKN